MRSPSPDPQLGLDNKNQGQGLLTGPVMGPSVYRFTFGPILHFIKGRAKIVRLGVYKNELYLSEKWPYYT